VPSPPAAEASSTDLAPLRAIVGDGHVLVDDDVRAGYERDWTGRFVGRAAAVVRPGSTDEVAAVLAWCSASGTAVVPQGGNTGLVGGSVPDGSGTAVVLSLRRLDALGASDAEAGQLTAGAGVALSQVQAAAAGCGWSFGVDLGARETASIGGMVATNAGGLHVVRHGAMRAQVLGVEAVLASGAVVRHLDGLVKDNTGYDLAGLLTGSEGTLGVVTAARLRLVPPVGATVTALIACDTAADAVGLAAEARRTLAGVVAIEAMWKPALELLQRELSVDCPVALPPSGVAVLVEIDAGATPVEDLAGLAGAREAVVATEPAPRARLWQLRERIAEAVAMVAVPHKLDVTLPLARLAPFTTEVGAALGTADAYLFGHLGDGNVHVNVVGPPADDDRVDEAVLRLVAQHGGSISAEHGIGRAKQPWLALSRSATELAAFRAIKDALDPKGILNPGVLLPA
jgi:FAD/FMN-containing dehydrogenase